MHEMSNPVFWKIRSSAELAQRVVKVEEVIDKVVKQEVSFHYCEVNI